MLSIVLLAKLIVDLISKKKKVEEIYLELVCTIGIFLLCVAATIFLMREKKEYKKIEHSNSNINLDEKMEKKEVEREKLPRSASCPELLIDERVLEKEVKGEVEKVKNTEENINKIGDYHSLTDQPVNTISFGKDENIIAVTLPENYSIKKYEGGKEVRSAKNGIIDDKYKPVDFSINKIEKVNEKGKKKDSYQFIFKFQSMQNANVFIEVSCDTLNVYSGWEKNGEKSVAQYFKALKANDDFLIFLDVKEIFSGFLGKVLTFAQKIFPANDQGLSSVAGKDAHKHFKREKGF